MEEDTLDTMVDGKTLREIIPTLPFTFQFKRILKQEDSKDMDQVLQLHKLLKNLFQWSMDNMRFKLASHWEELGESFHKIGLKEIDFRELMVITKDWNPTRQFRHLEVTPNRIRENQATTQAIEEKVNQIGNSQIPSGSQGIHQTCSSVASQAFLFGERSAQEAEVVVNNSRISTTINRNITPTQIENNVFTPGGNLNSDALWLRMSQCAEQTQKQFSELEASHERIKTLTVSMEKIVKNLQEGHAQSSKASEETNKILNLVFEVQNHSKEDRHCLDQDINKLCNEYHNMKPQQQGHVMDNPYQ
ncbi:hypothetical protein O181_060597 [Austropuccinia psidii MF-1]|uniref:Uncharacterized protein n=1 Tax=Austropuccinia psidii MF-1 TaxID=1389203 RepID=A0A9Q3EIZ6_9BASI|nr:hypothetical protein [Austropuccinia psidii MF-1]